MQQLYYIWNGWKHVVLEQPLLWWMISKISQQKDLPVELLFCLEPVSKRAKIKKGKKEGQGTGGAELRQIQITSNTGYHHNVSLTVKPKWEES